MPDLQIADYIANRKARGASDDEIKYDLKQTGWTTQQINEAFGETDDDTPPPPPNSPNPQDSHAEESMWSSFQNILTFISLAFFAGSIHTIWTLYINLKFPASSNALYSYSGSYLINGALSTLVVSAPFYIVLFFLTNKKFTKNPELKKTKGKRVINYITLTITFLILIFRLIAAVTKTIDSSFTPNFGLNLLVTFAVVGSIFAYYVYEVKFEKRPGSLRSYVLASFMLVLLAAVTFFFGLSVQSEAKVQRSEIENRRNNPPPLNRGTPIPAPSTNPSPTAAPGGLSYSLPVGWETIIDTTSSFEIGYNPQTHTATASAKRVDLNSKSPGASFFVTIAPYAGDKYEFIYSNLGVDGYADLGASSQTYQKMYSHPATDEQALFFYNISLSGTASAGMRVKSGGEAFFFTSTSSDEALVEQFLNSMKIY